MKPTTLLTLTLSTLTTAAPHTPPNPLTTFPTLSGLASRPGFYHLDVDGIYRAYLPDGTIIDAARVTRSHITTWLAARAPYLSAEAAAVEKSTYLSIDPAAVAEEQLMNPGEGVKPVLELRSMQGEGSQVERGSIFARACPRYNCVGTPYVCPSGQRCVCNGTNCQSY